MAIGKETTKFPLGILFPKVFMLHQLPTSVHQRHSDFNYCYPGPLLSPFQLKFTDEMNINNLISLLFVFQISKYSKTNQHLRLVKVSHLTISKFSAVSLPHVTPTLITMEIRANRTLGSDWRRWTEDGSTVTTTDLSWSLTFNESDFCEILDKLHCHFFHVWSLAISIIPQMLTLKCSFKWH